MTIQQKVKEAIENVRFVRQVTLALPKTSDQNGNIYFLKFRVKRPGEHGKNQFLALQCRHSSFDEEVEFFLKWCRKHWPGGRVSCRGMFHGPLRYYAKDGTEILFKGVGASPVNGMEEATP